MSTLKILLVEDNEDEELLALRALKKSKMNCEVVVARDGQEAVDYLINNNGNETGQDSLPQLVLLDIKLPKLNGLEVLRRIRANERTHIIPVVLLTSSTEESDLLDGYASGANSYINKPVEFCEFTDQLKMLSKYWLGVNRLPYG